VETYLTLNEAEQVDYRARLQQEEGGEDVEATELTWADRIAMRTRREDVKQVIELKFGRVSPEIAALIDTADTAASMTALLARVVAAETEEQLLPAT